MKFDRKWCLKHCPYRKQGQSLKWKTYSTFKQTFFYINNGKANPPCIVSSMRKYFFPKQKSIWQFIYDNVDMQTDAKTCPVYAQMMIENWNIK